MYFCGARVSIMYAHRAHFCMNKCFGKEYCSSDCFLYCAQNYSLDYSPDCSRDCAQRRWVEFRSVEQADCNWKSMFLRAGVFCAIAVCVADVYDSETLKKNLNEGVEVPRR